MSDKFDALRQELDSLGYIQRLHPQCVPLVQKLLTDLNITTSNLQKYMKISQQALEEKEALELGAEPYKCDNAKLIKECNDLHLAFIHFKERHEKTQRDLRGQIYNLQTRLDNCKLEKNTLMKQLQDFERKKSQKSSRIRERSANKDDKSNDDDKLSDIKRELKNLNEKYVGVVEDNVALQNQLSVRDDEIKRLQSLVEGSRSYKAISKECCYKNVDSQVKVLQDEITCLKKEKDDLQVHAQEALVKQHEAMRRALHLVERNKQLENELKDIDEIALAVEAECNNTVKNNSVKVVRLQDQINESLLHIQNLEKENAKLKQIKLELTADLESVRLEKSHIQKQLEMEIEDKKKLTDKINNYTIIENDLNLEIDRLVRLTAEQKHKIVELESRVAATKNATSQVDYKKVIETEQASEMSTKKAQTVGLSGHSKKKVEHKKTCKKSGKSALHAKSKSPVKMESSGDPVEQLQKCCCETGNCMKNLKELLDKEMEFRQTSAIKCLETLKQEKEYYMKEYHRVLEESRNIPTHERPDNDLVNLRQRLKEKEAIIADLESQISQLNNERSRLLSTANETANINGVCNNPICKRREREMEIQRNDLMHSEMEINTLKSKLQSLNETSVFNEERMKKAFQDMEEHIRKLEDERRDLVKTDLTQRSNISHLEEEYRNVKEQLRQVQNELNSQKASYNQLKLLHEQADRALSDAQAHIVRSEGELANYQSKMKDSSRESVMHDKEIAKLTSDIQIMKNQLSKLDREKDDLLNKLDEKTERNAALEDQLAAKSKALSSLESELKELKRKLSKYADETSSQDHLVRTKQQEVDMLVENYEKEKRQKDAAVLENKRLQNDLTSVMCDCRDARHELEISQRQIEDLKRQLQQYVSEVKRTEDLISQKEYERTELLDQFRCLSQEANILENNNHTLENEATQSRIQLSVALDHTSELEKKLENQDSIIRSYEKQIAQLTAQVASLEVQLKQNGMAQEHYETELKQLRDLCVKLDQDKDELKHQLYSKEDKRSQVEKTSERLRTEKDTIERSLDKERTNLRSVEKFLNEARQEAIDQRLLNEELQREIDGLKHRVEELQEKLMTTSEQLDMYQGKALEYSQLNKQLRRDIANERFSKSRDDDKGYYPSL